MAKPKTKAAARGRRKSLVDEYKAKARGKKTSTVSKKASVKESTVSAYQPILEMTVDGETYSKGDIAWYVLEGPQFSKRPRSGEITECHPNDRTAPCVTVIDEGFKHYRAIRIELIGWSKPEAKKKWEAFAKKEQDNPHFRG